jgi:hypothetical protein
MTRYCAVPVLHSREPGARPAPAAPPSSAISNVDRSSAAAHTRNPCTAPLPHKIPVLAHCQKAPAVAAMARRLTCLPRLPANDTRLSLAAARWIPLETASANVGHLGHLPGRLFAYQHQPSVLIGMRRVSKTVLDGEVVGPEPDGSLRRRRCQVGCAGNEPG